MDDKNTQSNNNGELKNVRTYLSDMADTVRANEVSVIKVALAEQNKHEREDLYRKAEGTPTKKILWIIGGLVFIALAIYGSYFFIKQKALNNAPEQIIKEEALIAYDEVLSLNVTDTSSLVDQLITATKKPNISNKSDYVKYISLLKDMSGAKEKLGVKEFFSIMNFTAPSSLIRALRDSYMVGTYTKSSGSGASIDDSKPNMFMLFQTNDYSYAYAGMLEWESTMGGDMLYLFDLDTKESKIKLGERQWKDIIVNNKDVRVLYNEENRPILYYLFADRNNLIIADNPNTIKEVLAKLVTKNIKPL